MWQKTPYCCFQSPIALCKWLICLHDSLFNISFAVALLFLKRFIRTTTLFYFKYIHIYLYPKNAAYKQNSRLAICYSRVPYDTNSSTLERVLYFKHPIIKHLQFFFWILFVWFLSYFGGKQIGSNNRRKVGEVSCIVIFFLYFLYNLFFFCFACTERNTNLQPACVWIILFLMKIIFKYLN